MRQKSRMV